MPTTPTETSVANAALVLLGERRISSLDENTKTAKTLKERLPEVRDGFLRQHFWNFAVTRFSLAADPDPPLFQYAYSYTLPADCIRLMELRNLGDYPHLVERGKIITDLSPPLEGKYIARVTDYNAWDVLAREALAAALAFDVAEAFTGTSTKVEQMAQIARQRLVQAQTADGQEDPPYYDEESEWSNARYEGDSIWWRVPSGTGTPY